MVLLKNSTITSKNLCNIGELKYLIVPAQEFMRIITIPVIDAFTFIISPADFIQ
ncbi:hypothetical protein [Halodesulfovibrio aestuarii]